jgi:hypothetical protein
MDNRCIRIYDLKQKIQYHPEVGTYVSEEDIDLAKRVFCNIEAKWVYDHWCEFKCSNCGSWSKSEPYRGREKYCSECGAKMRNGDGNDEALD